MWGRRLAKGIRAKDMKILAGRHLIKEAIELGHSPIIGEVGVFKGDFAMFLREAYLPKELHLFDLFRQVDQVGSGDVDGNNFEQCSGDGLYENAISLFAEDSRVTLHEGDSKCQLEKFSDNYFDLVYIDGDHSYRGCRSDLEVSFRKVKNRGWIAGHDFAINRKKCNSNWNFGVRQAVTEFCLANDLQINVLFLDGCVSYAIQVVKPESEVSHCDP